MVYGAIVVGQSVTYASDYQMAKLAVQNIFRLVDRQPKRQINNNCQNITPECCEGNLSFSEVHFHYPNRDEVKVLNGISFNAKKGETVALVGTSGCGKSTSIQLLERFYDCFQGKIVRNLIKDSHYQLILNVGPNVQANPNKYYISNLPYLQCLDANNINHLDVQWMRRQMALVSQEPILFSCSIRDNIAYGDNTRSVGMDEVTDAAIKANIHHFIKDLPQGYDTPVGNKGAQLSGGEKQRIAIARALVRNPRVLLLDEATSALDINSENLVQKALDEASKGRTCITIAHRLQSIQNADRIIVIEKGFNIEEGRHHELMERKGPYYRLYSVQTQ